MIERVSLGELVAPAESERAGNREFAVLSMTSSAGLVAQSSIFKKTIASRDVSNYKVVRPNQLVVGIHVDEGALGFSAANQTGIVSPAYSIWKLRSPDKVHIPYLDRFVRSPQAIAHFISYYRETAERRGKLTHDQFLALSVPFPALSEQRRIAAILDKTDALRAKRREAMAQLDRLSQSIFVGFFGDPSTNPKRWPIVSIGDLLDSASYGTSEKSDTSGQFPVLRMNNITPSGDMDFTDLKYMNLDESEHERYLVRAGDVLFNRTNSAELVGKTAIFRQTEPMAYAGYLIRLRTKAGNDPEYLAAFMNTPYMKRILRNMCKSIIGMANINATEVQSIKIAKPPFELQVQFRQRIESLNKAKASHRAMQAELNGLRSALHYRAFRGEL